MTEPVEYPAETVVSVAIKVPDVNLKFPIVIPEPVDNRVLPDAVLRTVPIRYLVAVEASVLTRAAEDAVPENVVAVMVPAEKLPELSLKTIDDAVFVDTADE